MKKTAIFFLLILSFNFAAAQSEKVELTNTVYEFLNRLHIKGIIKNYSTSSLPLSRKTIAEYIAEIDKKSKQLNDQEIRKLADLKIEFEYDLFLSNSNAKELFGSGNFCNNFSELFSEKEKYVYSYHDSCNTFFANALFESKSIFSTGDIFDNTNTSLFRWGIRFRGSINKNIGYYALATNGQIIGNRELAITEPALKNNYKLHEPNSKNFDFTEGYINYETDHFALQLGREKIRIGNGYNDQLLISPINALDFIKAGVKIGAINYTFAHNWLLSKEKITHDELTGDKRSIDSKYLALHRLGLSLFDDNLELGFSEMIIYSNRPVEIAYLTPLIFYKSVEHSLQDRDNALLTIDASYRFNFGAKLYGSFVIDELDFSKIGTNWWGNLFSYQIGAFIAEPMKIENLDINMEYLKILPYTFSHRFIENNYTNYNSYVGSSLNPNSDKLSVDAKYYLNNRLDFRIGFNLIRHGKNIEDNDGNVIKNVGGDINLGHRSVDSEESKFLDGDLEKSFIISAGAKYEVFNDIYLQLDYLHSSIKNRSTTKQNLINFIISINY